MNKEVIYLEPEDDITDILTKLQQAEQKLVALVPPKKATMLRSAVNMKLVARTAKECDKVAVIVTADPAIVKMAMTAQIPIAKTLQSRPVVPTKEDIDKTMAEEQVIDEDLADASAAAELDELKSDKNPSKTPAEGSKSMPEATSKKDGEIINLDEETLENGSKDGKKGKNKDKNGKNSKKVPSFEKYRKWIIIGSVAAVLLIAVGVWAFVFAPAAKITIAMNTSSESFSEEVKFVTDKNSENLESGTLFVEKQTFEQRYDADFAASGEEDRGEKAKGNVILTHTFSPRDSKNGISLSVTDGAEFVGNGQVYRATAGGSVNWDGDDTTKLKDICTSKTINLNSCTVKLTIPIEAVSSGEKFNLDKNSSWNNYNQAEVSNPDPITGGTTKNVTVVSLQDVHAARDKLVEEHAEENKTKLMDQLKKDDKLIMIEPSYAENVEDMTAKPEVGAEVDGGTTPSISIKISYSVYTVQKSQLEKFIESKLSIGEDQRIYSIGEPYFDRYNNLEEPARLKTTVKIGPTVTEETIIERTKGKKIGEVQSLLRSINGVDSVNVSPSYFWVRSVPNDPSRIEVDLTVEDKE